MGIHPPHITIKEMKRNYKTGRRKGERTTMCCTFMLDVDNRERWESLEGKSRWINEQLRKEVKP